MSATHPILPPRGRWQREALTEGARRRAALQAPSTTLRAAVPLPRWGRIIP